MCSAMLPKFQVIMIIAIYDGLSPEILNINEDGKIKQNIGGHQDGQQINKVVTMGHFALVLHFHSCCCLVFCYYLD